MNFTQILIYLVLLSSFGFFKFFIFRSFVHFLMFEHVLLHRVGDYTVVATIYVITCSLIYFIGELLTITGLLIKTLLSQQAFSILK